MKPPIPLTAVRALLLIFLLFSVISFVFALESPINLLATAYESDRIVLTFDFESTVVNEYFVSFRAQYRQTGALDWINVTQPLYDTPPTTAEYKIGVGGLTCSTDYEFRVIASAQSEGDSLPTEPQPGRTFSCLTSADAPAPVTLTVINPWRVNVNWVDKGPNETRYFFEFSLNNQSWQRIATLPANTTTYQMIISSCNTPFRFRIFAANNSGKSTAAGTPSKTLPCTPPTAPANLTYYKSITDERDIYFQWTGSEGVFAWNDGYRIQRALNTADKWETVKEVRDSLTPAIYREHLCGSPVHYRVLAFNSAGASQPSNILTVDPLPCRITFTNADLQLNVDDKPRLPDGWQPYKLEPDDTIMCATTGNCQFRFKAPPTFKRIVDGFWQHITSAEQPNLALLQPGEQIEVYARIKPEKLTLPAPGYDYVAACLYVSYRVEGVIYESDCKDLVHHSNRYYLARTRIAGRPNIDMLEVFVLFQSRSGTLKVDDFGITVIPYMNPSRDDTGPKITSRWPSQSKQKLMK